MSVATAEELVDERLDGRWERDLVVADPERRLVAVHADSVCGEPTDAAGGLRVDDGEQARDAVVDSQGLVVKELRDERDAFVGWHHAGKWCGASRDAQLGAESLPAGPGEERDCVVSGRWSGAEPPVHIRLFAIAEILPAVTQPGHERNGDTDLLSSGADRTTA
jgi:hypothetical protein